MPNSKKKNAVKWQKKKKLQAQIQTVKHELSDKQDDTSKNVDSKTAVPNYQSVNDQPQENFYADEDDADIFKPGTIVKIKNLKSRPEMNGILTVVTHKLLDNGRVPVMMDRPNSFALKQECLEVVDDCPNIRHEESKGIIVWPRIAGMPTPSCKWSDIPLMKFIQLSKDGSHEESIQRDAKLEDLHVAFTNAVVPTLGWTRPNFIKFHSGFIGYDTANNGPINEWLDLPGKLSRQQVSGVTIRGPLIHIEFRRKEEET